MRSFTAACLPTQLELVPFPHSGLHFQLSGSITLQIPLESDECILETISGILVPVKCMSVFRFLQWGSSRGPELFTCLLVLYLGSRSGSALFPFPYFPLVLQTALPRVQYHFSLTDPLLCRDGPADGALRGDPSRSPLPAARFVPRGASEMGNAPVLREHRRWLVALGYQKIKHYTRGSLSLALSKLNGRGEKSGWALKPGAAVCCRLWCVEHGAAAASAASFGGQRLVLAQRRNRIGKLSCRHAL